MLVHAGVLLTLVGHSRQAAAQTLSIRRMTSSSEPVRRVMMRPVMLHISAQSRSRRMHWVRSCTMRSDRHASAQEVQIWAQE
jgi:hypothetical protein